jgi:hypothetical protein
MPAARNYSSVAAVMQLTDAVSGSSTILNVDAVSGLPATPFTLVIDPGSVSEEIVTVTSISALNLTVTRGVDGTAAVSHGAGATVRHMATGRDFQEFQDHAAAATNVHGVGLTASVVGTTTTQTLTNKTISGAGNTLTNINGSSLVDGSVPGAKLGTDVNAATVGGIKVFILSSAPSYSGAANTAIWVKS